MSELLKGFSWAWESLAACSEALPMLAAAGFDGVETTFGSAWLNAEVPENLKALHKRAEDQGLRVPSLRGGKFLWQSVSSPDAGQRVKALDYGKAALDAVAGLGGDVLLVVPGASRPDTTYQEHWTRAVEFCRAMGDEAAKRGLSIGVENVENGFPLAITAWQALIAEIGHPAVGMYLDAGNIVWLDHGFPDQWIRAMAGHIRRIHVKGAKRRGSICPLFEGEVDWPAVMRAIREVKYAGWIIVEPANLPLLAPEHFYRTQAGDMEMIFCL